MSFEMSIFREFKVDFSKFDVSNNEAIAQKFATSYAKATAISSEFLYSDNIGSNFQIPTPTPLSDINTNNLGEDPSDFDDKFNPPVPGGVLGNPEDGLGGNDVITPTPTPTPGGITLPDGTHLPDGWDDPEDFSDLTDWKPNEDNLPDLGDGWGGARPVDVDTPLNEPDEKETPGEWMGDLIEGLGQVFGSRAIEAGANQAAQPQPPLTPQEVTLTPSPTLLPSNAIPEVIGATAPQDISAYQVQPGDNLSSIAERHGVTLEALIAANPQIADPNMIGVGEAINLPGGTMAGQPAKQPYADAHIPYGTPAMSEGITDPQSAQQAQYVGGGGDISAL